MRRCDVVYVCKTVFISHFSTINKYVQCINNTRTPLDESVCYVSYSTDIQDKQYQYLQEF